MGYALEHRPQRIMGGRRYLTSYILLYAFIDRTVSDFSGAAIPFQTRFRGLPATESEPPPTTWA